MLRLRPYKSCDAPKIALWLTDEDTFLKWGGNHFGEFPISAEIIDKKYMDDNGDCPEEDNFYPMVAFNDEGVVGHFIMRYLDGDNRKIRFGWVITDASKRGMGYGKQMLTLGLEFAFNILKVNEVTLGVFENNIPAYRCYKSVGFVEDREEFRDIKGEQWKLIELKTTAYSQGG